MDARFAAAGSPRGARTLAAVGFALALLCLSLPAPAAVQAKTRIVWSSIDPDFSRQRLVTAQPNGSHRQELTDPKAAHTHDIDAQFSPDGTQVAFARELRNGKDAQIVLIGADGENERVLDLGCVDPCALDIAPTWADRWPARLHPGHRAVRPGQRLGPLGGAADLDPRRLRHPAALRARHRRRL